VTVIVFFTDGHFEVFEDVSDLSRRDGRVSIGHREFAVYGIAKVEVLL
jgi:hypothetical protein